MLQIFQPTFHNATEILRRSALLLTLLCMVLCCPVPGQIVGKGEAVATHFPGFDPTTGNVIVAGNVIAVIDVRNKNSDSIQPGTNWSGKTAYPGLLLQVNGTCYSPTAPDGNNPPNKDPLNNPSGGPKDSILCYPPTGYGSPAPPSSTGVYPSGGPSGTDPTLNGVPSSYEWSGRTMGYVYGVALDNEGDIFTTASSVYGDFNDPAINCPTASAAVDCPTNKLGGLVFRIDHLTGLVTPFITACNKAT